MSDEEFTKEELEKILSDGNFDLLEGKIENIFFDCKKGPYDLSKNSEKRTLAKDVSSFANKTGGYILIGPEAKRSDIHFGDQIKKVHLMPKTIVNKNMYYDIIREWIYPPIDGLKVQWKYYKNDPTKGIVIIKIPQQKESTKPFLITKTVDEEKKSEIMFGYAIRKEDRSESKRVEDIHKTHRDGMLYEENLSKRFDNLEAMILEVQYGVKKEKVYDFQKTLENKLEETLKVNEMCKERTFMLVGYVNEPQTKLCTLFSNMAGGTKSKLENPSVIRNNGWNLKTNDTSKIIKGEYVRVNNFQKCIDLYRDGMLITAALANDDYLCWVPGGVQITPLALIEFVCEFVAFFYEIIKDLKDPPKKVSMHFGFRNLWLEEKKNFLIPGDPKEPFSREKCFAQESDYFSLANEFSATDYDIERIAYLIVKEIYIWFGITLDRGNIPYTKIENTVEKIDINQIRAIR